MFNLCEANVMLIIDFAIVKDNYLAAFLEG